MAGPVLSTAEYPPLPWTVDPEFLLRQHRTDSRKSAYLPQHGISTSASVPDPETRPNTQKSSETIGVATSVDAESVTSAQQLTDMGDWGAAASLFRTTGNSRSTGTPDGFGSSTTRIELFPRLGVLDRASGTSEFGNGRIMGRMDPIWGAPLCSPDYLNKSGAYKAPTPGENLNRGEMYWDMAKPMQAKLWSKTKASRIQTSGQYPEPYLSHISCTVDPYDVSNKLEALRKQGTISSDPKRPSSGFAAKTVRRGIDQQIQFNSYWVDAQRPRAPTPPPETEEGCDFPSSPPWHRSPMTSRSSEFPMPPPWRPGTDRPDTAASTGSDWARWSGKFGKLYTTTPQSVAKFDPPEAPPPTYYEPRLPYAPTISEKAKPRPSERPGIRGGLYRESLNGTPQFTSRSLREFQDPPADLSPLRMKSRDGLGIKTSPHSEAPVSAWLRTPSTVSGVTAGTRVAVGNLMLMKQLREKDQGFLVAGDPRADSESGPTARIDNLLTNWELRNQRAEFFSARLTGERLLTEDTIDRWRALMW